jgi:lipopolysaccharide biosynthesis regulator YciM
MLIILYSGCGVKPSPQAKGHEKAFDKEDIYILIGLRTEQIQNYSASADIFNALYEKTNKKEYLYRSLGNDLAANRDKKVLEKIDKLLNKEIGDFKLIEIKIITLIKQNRFNEAKELSLRLVEKSKDIDHYLLVGEIYIKLKEFDNALRYLEGAYIKNYNEKILDKISIILYVNLQRKNDAIAQLETHSRIYGCSDLICSRLIGFYSNDNNINGLLSTYLRVYKVNSSKDIAKKIVQIYGYQKNYIKMIEFLQDSKIDDELLLKLYIQSKDYKKASPLAYKLYQSSGDVSYLGQSAIFEYESSDDKNDKTMQKSVITKLTNAIEIKKDGVYLNYLGYLLIDHEIDVKKGIKYVEEALSQEANSIYFLDSLAWGYYKLDECKKAKNIIDEVINMDGSSNAEVIKHIELINKCNKEVK